MTNMKSNDKLKKIKTELVKREAARNNLLDFVKYNFPSYEIAKHHELIAQKLEDVEKGKITRLMIAMPPRHGKTELASKQFPAWYLGRHPSSQVIAATYNNSFAKDFGRSVRNILTTSAYQNIFDTKVQKDSKSAAKWHTNKGGVFVSAGPKGGVTGRGGDLIIIDDPIKDRADADSANVRNKIWEWYTQVIHNRLQPGGKIILIMTRWHEDDLAGRLLEQQELDGEKWEVLSLPAISKDKKALWPSRFPLEVLETERLVSGVRSFEALYQQNPTPQEGNYFKRDWFHRYSPEDLPKKMNIFASSDFAVTYQGGDFTEHGVFGVDASDNVYVLDWWYGQVTSDVWIDRLFDLINKYRPIYYFCEKGQIWSSVAQFFYQRSRERKVFCRVEAVSKVHNKELAATTFQGRAAMYKVWIPKGPLGDRLIEEIIKFPTGAHDDVVDTFSLLFLQLTKLFGPMIYKENASTTIKKKDGWETYNTTTKNWKTV